MNISELFIRRSVATSLLTAGIILFGVVAYNGLAVSDLPTVDFPTLTVSATLPGASPETMASAVATPLERQFTGIAGINSMASTNTIGSTSITLQFDLNRTLDSVAVDVETAISQATPLLPPGMPSPPSFRKSNPSDSPIMFFGLTSPTLPLSELDRYGQTVIAQRISMVTGVAQVGVWSSQKYAVRIQADPQQLAARKIGINEVAAAIQSWNVNIPTGTLYGPNQSFTVLANGQLMNADAFKPMIIAWRKGVPVRLREIANVIDSVEDDKTMSWFWSKEGSTKGINLMVMRQPGSNVIETTDAIKKLIPELQSQLPPAVNFFLRGDRSLTIRESFNDVRFTMMFALLLVVMVIFVFLRKVPATVIPALALPVSLFGTFSLMYVLGYSLDNLSMMALILSIGFVVDDAIVMLENIVRHIEKGENPMAAAFKGSSEVSFTIVSMTLSLAAVFIPILFMSGLLGRLFKEFAVTICATILLSGFVSITLTPMLCSRFLNEQGQEKRGWFYRVTEKFFDAMLAVYKSSLRWVLRYRPVMMAVFFLVLAATIRLFMIVPKGFIPDQDSDQLYVNTETAPGTSPYQLAKYQREVEQVLNVDPNIDTFQSSYGGSMFGMGATTGRMFVQLVPRRKRQLNVRQIIEQLRPKLSRFPGIRVFPTAPQSIRIGTHMSKSQYQFVVQAPDTSLLYGEAQKLESELMKLPDLRDVTTDVQIRNPTVNLVVDRKKAAALQLDLRTIESGLYDMYGPSWVSTMYMPQSQNRVMLELLPKYQESPDWLSQIFFKSSDGNLVPLDTIARRVERAGPQQINHSGQLPSVTLSFDFKPGVSLGQAVDEIQKVADSVLPQSVSTGFQGTAKVFQESLQNLGLLLVIATAVVYIVLGVLYESYIHPLTILSGLPSAGFGALLTLYLFHVELNIYGYVGLIMLIGLVKKNAIMQIDVALDCERKLGMPPLEAIYEGCIVRFRPIMMTTMAALFSALPIALGRGAGGEARASLGLSVVGGLLFSQLITLYLTPVVYTYLDGVVGWLQNRKKGVSLSPAPAPAGD